MAAWHRNFLISAVSLIPFHADMPILEYRIRTYSDYWGYDGTGDGGILRRIYEHYYGNYRHGTPVQFRRSLSSRIRQVTAPRNRLHAGPPCYESGLFAVPSRHSREIPRKGLVFVRSPVPRKPYSSPVLLAEMERPEGLSVVLWVIFECPCKGLLYENPLTNHRRV